MNLRNKVAQLWIKSVPIAFVQQRQHPRFYPIKTQTKDCAKHWLGFCVPHEVQQTIFCAKPMKKLWLSATHLPPQRRCKLPRISSAYYQTKDCAEYRLELFCPSAVQQTIFCAKPMKKLWLSATHLPPQRRCKLPRISSAYYQTKDCAEYRLELFCPSAVQQTIFCAKPMKKLWLSATHLPPQRRCKLPQFLSPFPFTQRKNEPARTRSFLIRRDRRILYACHISYHALIYHKSIDGFISFIICL